ncbi:hypothetical protein QVD17_16077 [Tagetes erecta]|uniref:Uncharacterized protein n=1 Tax=Tagetes erecta TaxID=13708 RepID=A0AAD8KQA3_TARER|nr:hypothetical protein QVD17_16077 [Tagetes erecta]
MMPLSIFLVIDTMLNDALEHTYWSGQAQEDDLILVPSEQINLEDEDAIMNLEDEYVTINLEEDDVCMSDHFLNILCFDKDDDDDDDNDDDDEVVRKSIEDYSESEKDNENDVGDDKYYKDESVLYPCYDPCIDLEISEAHSNNEI